ncbi:TPA: hypothetical protein TXU88_001540 [Streptococcus suis]|nr:hypothetical protein [Streptococcus suis]HEM2651300.1 hypothetical protein [Streptococcus suis]
MTKILKFIEKYFFWIFVVLALLFFSITYFFFRQLFDKVLCWIMEITYSNDSNLITISTVFIGIYFTLYTYLLSIDSNSILAKIELREFKKLARMINVGFISSLAVVLCSFLKTNQIWYYLAISVLVFLLLISAIEIAIYYTLIFKRDLDSKFIELQTQELVSRKDDELKKELRNFLERNK